MCRKGTCQREVTENGRGGDANASDQTCSRGGVEDGRPGGGPCCSGCLAPSGCLCVLRCQIIPVPLGLLAAACWEQSLLLRDALGGCNATPTLGTAPAPARLERARSGSPTLSKRLALEGPWWGGRTRAAGRLPGSAAPRRAPRPCCRACRSCSLRGGRLPSVNDAARC
jgi:hypothetical protein